MPILKWGHSWSVKVAVVAHAKKRLGGGLPELRTELRRRGHAEVVWRGHCHVRCVSVTWEDRSGEYRNAVVQGPSVSG